jgi:hypothetical protein
MIMWTVMPYYEYDYYYHCCGQQQLQRFTACETDNPVDSKTNVHGMKLQARHPAVYYASSFHALTDKSTGGNFTYM